MKKMPKITVPISLLCVNFFITFALGFIFGAECNDHASWSRGYGTCMTDVVTSLASHDEVYLGNLVINEPNAYVSDVTFFVVDPNQWGVLFDDVADGTVIDCTFSSLGTFE